MISVGIGAASYGVGAALFLLLTALLLTAWRGRLQGGLLVAACAVSMIWCAAAAWYVATDRMPLAALLLLEILRDAAWFLFLLKLLGYARGSREARVSDLHVFSMFLLVVCVSLVGLVLATRFAPSVEIAGFSARDTILSGFLIVSVSGLALVEQAYRNTLREHRWAIKFLCFGIGGFFAYDLYLYSHAMLFKQIDSSVWNARGIINALMVPLIAVSARRNPEWSVEIFVSRHVVFHSFALLGAGVYLVLMAGAGYYIKLYGGTWGGIAQIVFLFGALLLLLALMFSGQVRSRLKVFVGKHFFKNKYDYREEWLRFTEILSRSAEDAELRRNVIRGMGELMESPSGTMWCRDGEGDFVAVTRWNSRDTNTYPVPGDAPLARFLRRTGWVVYVDEYRAAPDRYDELRFPEWFDDVNRPWVIVPLLHADVLVGFVLLNRSNTRTALNWEDSDLLRTIGRQAASYVALMETSDALAAARQFEAFNRLSAYIVHDLKNVAAQLSLLVSNARRHMHSDGFVEDAVGTVENATAKMNKLLGQLRKGRLEGGVSRRVDLAGAVESAVKARTGGYPVPTLEISESGVAIDAEPDRFVAVLEHLIQNAQEATPAGGHVWVRLGVDVEEAVIDVEDDGCGMDEQFVARRLFKPFDTTKGNAGMGVGVYESREFVESIGGRIDVRSRPGEGTRFRIRLPLRALDGERKRISGLEAAR